MLPKQLVILGGGASIRPYWDGVHKDKGLFELLPKLFSCGLNYSYRFVESTVYCGIDEKFFNENFKDIIKMPLFLGKTNYSVTLDYGKNKMYLFNSVRTYDRDLYAGIYSPTLAGLFAISTFIKLMDEGEIYLLGFDYGPTRDEQGKPITDQLGRVITHWYQSKVEHRGIGKTAWYTSTHDDPKKKGATITNAEREFGVYAKESKVKIYNVNPQSVIPTFEKISYEQFFTKISIPEHNQNDIRKDLELKFKALNFMYADIARNPIQFGPQGTIMPGRGPFDVR
jgi:hypothetical protein